MNKTAIIFIIVILAGAGLYLLFAGKENSASNQPGEESYKDISSSELDSMLFNKDFKLIDVHLPEQKHIPKTDAFIPYNNIDDIMAFAPDKKEKIVLYCRSGGMSSVVADKLAWEGYTNVYNLTGGMNAWSREGRETVPIGSVKAK